MRRIAHVLTLLLFAGCAAATSSGGGSSGLPMTSGGLRAEDRVVLRDFSRVNALAASIDRVYIAYPGALGIWRPLEHRWEIPRTPPDLAMMRSVISAMVDPADQSVWLVARNGWLHYSADIDRWDEGNVPATILGLAVDPAQPQRGVWLRTASGWLLQPRIGGIAAPAAPPRTLTSAATIDDAMRDLPPLRTYGQQILTGPRFDRGVFTAAVASVDGRGWFVGTSNHGAAYVDRVAALPEMLTLGITGDEVGALAATSDGIWTASNQSISGTAGLSEIVGDLQSVTPHYGPGATGFPFGVINRILPDGNRLWLATDQGAVRLTLPDDRTEIWNEARGLADRRALSLARVGEVMMVGTMRGVVQIDRDGVVARRDANWQEPVYALHSRGDTLWVGSAAGLFALLPKDEVLQRPNGLHGVLSSRIPVMGIGYLADTLVAMTSDQLLWRSPLTGEWTAGPVLSGQVGPLVDMHVSPNGIWVAGERGVGVTRPGRALQNLLTFPRDVPGRVTSVVSQGGWLWVGTTAGLVRFRLNR